MEKIQLKFWVSVFLISLYCGDECDSCWTTFSPKVEKLMVEANENSQTKVDPNFKNFSFTDPAATADTCFEYFNSDKDGGIDRLEFDQLLKSLFQNEDTSTSYPIEPAQREEMFAVFNTNTTEDGNPKLDNIEFQDCWKLWIQKIIRPVSALIIVDVQNDFISGSLALSNSPAGQNGSDVIEPFNRLIDSVNFDRIYYSLDWHPENHISFIDNVSKRKLSESSPIKEAKDVQVFDTVIFELLVEGPPPTEQRLWPKHCVQNSWGAKLDDRLKIANGSVFIYKGKNPEVDSYSAFFDNAKVSATELVAELEKNNVTDAYFGGLAYDVCVGSSALHSLELGYRTILIEDASRGIILADIDKMRQTILDRKGAVVQSDQVKSMVEGRDRRPELGLKLALELAKRKSESREKASL